MLCLDFSDMRRPKPAETVRLCSPLDMSASDVKRRIHSSNREQEPVGAGPKPRHRDRGCRSMQFVAAPDQCFTGSGTSLFRAPPFFISTGRVVRTKPKKTTNKKSTFFKRGESVCEQNLEHSAFEQDCGASESGGYLCNVEKLCFPLPGLLLLQVDHNQKPVCLAGMDMKPRLHNEVHVELTMLQC